MVLAAEFFFFFFLCHKVEAPSAKSSKVIKFKFFLPNQHRFSEEKTVRRPSWISRMRCARKPRVRVVYALTRVRMVRSAQNFARVFILGLLRSLLILSSVRSKMVERRPSWIFGKVRIFDFFCFLFVFVMQFFEANSVVLSKF